MKSREQISKDMKAFVGRIMEVTADGSYDDVKALSDEIAQYKKSNNVPDELNYIRLSGYGEMLAMSLSALERTKK